MTDTGLFIPWIYVLVAIHLAALWVIYHCLLRPKNKQKPVVEEKSFPFETEARPWESIFLIIVVGAICFKPYHQFLSESATLLTLLSMYLLSRQKKTEFIKIAREALVVEAKDKEILFERIISIKFAKDHIEIWSKHFVEHYHEFTKHELKENWDLFKKELLLAVEGKDWITITTTAKSQATTTQPPRSSPLPESETHTDK